MRKRIITAAVMLLAIPGFHVLGQTKPETVVANLYTAERTKGIADMTKTELQKYFNKELADSIWKVTHSDNGIDINILYNAQDTRIKNFSVGKSKSDGGAAGGAYVTVTFENFGKREKIEFHVVYEAFSDGKEGWRILDVLYAGGHYLTEILETDN